MRREALTKAWTLAMCLLVLGAPALAQTTKVSEEYLMTVRAPLDPPQVIDPSLSIYNVRPGGWARGPKIAGALIAPSGDWMRVMPSGVSRLDVRLTIRTEDGALIYMSYNGVVRETKADGPNGPGEYFVIAPTFETSSPHYDWLNGAQCVGKVVEDTDDHVKYDIFIIR